MNTSIIAKALEGREYTKEITTAERASAKEHGIVVVYGGSDDLMEFAGAIYDEVDCFGGGSAYLTTDGLLENACEDGCPYFEAKEAIATKIEAVFDNDGYTWTYKTDIPHETFNIMEGNEFYCRGIVFKLSDVKK